MTSVAAVTLPGMPTPQARSLPEPESPARCATCGRNFATVRLFDRHLRRSMCIDPVQLGLTFDGAVWR